jgi:hypothetical protein
MILAAPYDLAVRGFVVVAAVFALLPSGASAFRGAPVPDGVGEHRLRVHKRSRPVSRRHSYRF